MNPLELKVKELFFADVGTAENYEDRFNADLFSEFELTAPIQFKAKFVRVKEGIAMNIDSIQTKMKVICVRCQKSISWPLKIEGDEEWFYWEKGHEPEKSEEEIMFVEMRNWSVNLREPIREEILLALPIAPRCVKKCIEFKEAEEPETKPLGEKLRNSLANPRRSSKIHPR